MPFFSYLMFLLTLSFNEVEHYLYTHLTFLLLHLFFSFLVFIASRTFYISFSASKLQVLRNTTELGSATISKFTEYI